MRRRWMVTALAVSALVATSAGGVGAAPTTVGQDDATTAADAAEGGSTSYVVLYDEGADAAAARAAIEAAGGVVVSENGAIGMATVQSESAGFLTRVAAASDLLAGAARNSVIGTAGLGAKRDLATDPAAEDGSTGQGTVITGAAGPRAEQPDPDDSAGSGGADDPDQNVEPLADLQWDLAAIDATAAGSYDTTTGRRSVMVGVIDTGIDASHPDLVDRVDVDRSRNFTTDIPIIDGECAEDPDGSCDDPADVDENGHGTHIAGTIAASVNGYGIAGILPKTTLVNLRAGQDSGFFFVDATVNALTYAGDIGVDVVNMSFYVDPWLYNCTANPADSPDEQAEQATIIESVQRAVDYARDRGVTTISALGNEATDLGNPAVDATSPDFPPETARVRTVDNSCLDVPTETDGVISVSSIGPSLRKADYSNYGIEQTDVSAPGGWFRDGFGTDSFQTPQNMILSTWPADVAEEETAANGGVLPDDFVQYCGGDVCAYYKYIQGTSMAAPHAVGVAALAVSYWGADDPERNADGTSRGRTLDPETVERILLGTAIDTPCPPGGAQSYADEGRPPSFDATCVGDSDRNGFYGDGIVNALSVIRYGAAYKD